MVRHYKVARRRMRGRGIKEFFSGVSNFLKKHRIISGIGGAVTGLLPEKYRGLAQMATKGAHSLGYGRRRRRVVRCGRGLRLAGN